VNLSDQVRLRGLVETLTRLFYCLMAGALFIAVFGSAGFALFLLILGACAHVARVGVEGLLETRPKRRAVRPTSG
jgi:hypothetical protein